MTKIQQALEKMHVSCLPITMRFIGDIDHSKQTKLAMGAQRILSGRSHDLADYISKGPRDILDLELEAANEALDTFSEACEELGIKWWEH